MIHIIRKLSSSVRNSYVFLFFFPFLLTIAIEKINHGTWHDTLKWISDSFPPLIFNYVIILSCCLLVSMIIGNFHLGFFVCSTILIVLTSASVLKSRSLGQPLLPWDLTLNKEGLDISRYVVGNDHRIFILEIMLFIICSIVVIRRLPRLQFSLLPRVAIASISFAILFALAFSYKPMDLLKDKYNITEIYWDQNQNYKQNGLFMAFLTNMRHAYISAPPSYNEKNIKNVKQDIEKNKEIKTVKIKENMKKPNIIFVMSESFWDPTRISGISFSPDPLRCFHSLQKKYTSGWLFSPQYGGGTANVEFEVLTGHSTDFLPQGSIPYEHFIRQPISSIARILTEQGYKSVAIHSYNGWFWNRKKVYPLLGFQTFISSEGFSHPEIKGNFIADKEVSRTIITHTEQNTLPLFIFAVTMQNHGPYNDHRYKQTQIKVTGNLSITSKQILETYAQGVADADRSLELLVHYYQKSKEPTIIVFFGDHLPMLGEHYSVYTETKYISTNDTTHWTNNDYQNMRNVPVLIWSNYDLPKQQIHSLPTSFLGPYVMDTAKLNQTDYFQFLNHLSAKKNRAKTTAEDHAKYWLLEYDQLFGKNYLNSTK